MKKLVILLLVVIASSFFFFESDNGKQQEEARKNLITFVIGIKDTIDTDKYRRALKSELENPSEVVQLKYVHEENGYITAEGTYDFEGECREVRITWKNGVLFKPKTVEVSKNEPC